MACMIIQRDQKAPSESFYGVHGHGQFAGYGVYAAPSSHLNPDEPLSPYVRPSHYPEENGYASVWGQRNFDTYARTVPCYPDSDELFSPYVRPSHYPEENGYASVRGQRNFDTYAQPVPRYPFKRDQWSCAPPPPTVPRYPFKWDQWSCAPPPPTVPRYPVKRDQWSFAPCAQTVPRYPGPAESISQVWSPRRDPVLRSATFTGVRDSSEADIPTISHQTDWFARVIAVNSQGAGWVKQFEQYMIEILVKIGSSDSLETSKNLGELTVLIHLLNGVITIKGEGTRTKEWLLMTDHMESPERPRCFQGSRRLMKPLALLAATVCVMPLAAAADLAPYLRIGCGFASVTTAVSLIPLRRDERVGIELLIPMYTLSLTCTALFILLQYLNIVRLRGRYLFGTFLLAGHFVVGLSQTSDSALEGVVDFGPIIVPVVAAVFSLLFRRRQPTLAVVAEAAVEEAVVEDPLDHEELDIGLEGMQNLVGAVVPL